LRIFIGPVEVAGLYTKLAQGFRLNGVKADFVQLYDHPFSYGDNKGRGRISNTACLLNQKMHSSNRGVALLATTGYLCFRLIIFPYLLLTYQVFIFTWGESLLPLRFDLPILKLFKRKTISVIGHGSEARPPYLSFNAHSMSSDLDKYIAKQTKKTSRKVSFIERWSSEVVGLPTTDHFLTKPYFNFFKLGLPTNLVVNNDPNNSSIYRNFRILHAPSKSEIKGTNAIRIIMDRICLKYKDVEYVEISNVPNAEVLNEIAKSQLVIDQLYSDIPIAAIGVEAGSYGVPCVIAVGGMEFWRKNLGESQLPPSIACDVKDVETTIENYILNRKLLNDAGSAIKFFLAENWNCKAVAARYLKIIFGEADDKFLETPGRYMYLKGGGIPSDVALKQICRIVEKYGLQGLRMKSLNSDTQLDIDRFT
jgi:hypothetical protein